MTSAISNAVQGLKRAGSRLAESVKKIAVGSAEPETIVEVKANETDFRMQAKNVKIMLDKDKDVLDILS